MSATTSDASSITVVLVHGAFADSSSWNGVIERLQADGFESWARLRQVIAGCLLGGSFVRQRKRLFR